MQLLIYSQLQLPISWFKPINRDIFQQSSEFKKFWCHGIDLLTGHSVMKTGRISNKLRKEKGKTCEAFLCHLPVIGIDNLKCNKISWISLIDPSSLWYDKWPLWMHCLEPPQIAYHQSGPHSHGLNPKPPGERPSPRQGHTWPLQPIE